MNTLKNTSFEIKIIYHILFWLFYYFLNVVRWGTYFNDYEYSLKSNLLEFSLHIPLVYIHIYYLIPKYVLVRKYYFYTFYLVLSLILVYILKTVLTYYLISKYVWPESNLNYHPFDFNHILAVIIGEIYVLAMCCWIYLIVVWINERNTNKLLVDSQLETKLTYLRMQIQPHFFFNTLNNLYSLSLKSSDKVSEVIIKLSNLMEYVLYDIKGKSNVPLIKEINYIESYIELEKLRYENISVIINIEKSIENIFIPPLILISFIENSFKHGTTENTNFKLKISFNIINEKLEVTIINNFVSLEQIKKTNRIGIENTLERLNLIYNNNYIYKQFVKKNFYIVYLQIPFFYEITN